MWYTRIRIESIFTMFTQYTVNYIWSTFPLCIKLCVCMYVYIYFHFPFFQLPQLNLFPQLTLFFNFFFSIIIIIVFFLVSFSCFTFLYVCIDRGWYQFDFCPINIPKMGQYFWFLLIQTSKFCVYILFISEIKYLCFHTHEG